MTRPTRFIRAEAGGKMPNTVSVSVPAPDMVKGGLGMLLIGIWGFLTRRDVTWEMRYYDR